MHPRQMRQLETQETLQFAALLYTSYLSIEIHVTNIWGILQLFKI